MNKVFSHTRTSVKLLVLSSALILTSGCSIISNVLNPFYEPPTETALKGERNDHAISGGGSMSSSRARAALESLGAYQRAHDPQPVNPVINPAVVRLMWIPDHLSAHGDMIPAHYYYLKVKEDQWALTDAFDLDNQLRGSTGGTSSNVPYVFADDAQQQ
jgi:hypothetical protein